MDQLNQKIALKLEDSTGYTCDSCGGIFFTEALMLRRWSKLLTGTTEDYIQPVPCFRCSDCGTPLKAFFPKGMKDVEDLFDMKEVEPVTGNSNLIL